MLKHLRKINVLEGSEAHGKAQVGAKMAQDPAKMGRDGAKIGQDGRR